MAPRYVKTRKVWPAGVMALSGAAAALYEAQQTLNWM